MPLNLSRAGPPDDVFVRSRVVSRAWAQWAYECDAILNEHGTVQGVHAFDSRPSARWRAKHLISLLVDLRLKQRWELVEHTWPRRDGKYAWSVEYVRRPIDARAPAATGPAYR